jgi:hypothetical protein
MPDKFENLTDAEIEAEAMRRRQAAAEARRAEALEQYQPLLAKIADLRALAEDMRPLHTPELLALNDGMWGRLRTWIQITDQLIAKADQVEANPPGAQPEPTPVPEA